MKRLKISYVHHLSLPEDLSPQVVQVYIGTAGNKVEMSILRRGFVVADPVIHRIESRIQELDQATARRGRSVAESVGLYPDVAPEWLRFLDDLLQREDSWAFLVPMMCRPERHSSTTNFTSAQTVVGSIGKDPTINACRALSNL